MPNFIVKLDENKYCRWSSVTDSPITYLTNTREEAISQFGREDVEAADQNGCSCCDKSIPGNHIQQILECNSAGLNEESINLQEILMLYCNVEG
jgi:hypothetical protein